MLFLNTIKNSSGEVLTGKLWRQESSLFSNLPFHSNIMGMDEITRPLQEALSISMSEEWHNKLLVVSKVLMTSILDKSFPQKIGTGLDQVHPFSDTNAVAIVLCPMLRKYFLPIQNSWVKTMLHESGVFCPSLSCLTDSARLWG